MEEIWMPVKGWEDFYEVSNSGIVRTKERIYYLKNTPKKLFSRKIKADKHGEYTLRARKARASIGSKRLVFDAFCKTGFIDYIVKLKDKKKEVSPDNLIATEIVNKRHQLTEFIGKRLGAIHVVKYDNQIWKCTCDCGNELKLSTQQIKRAKVRDCGYRCKIRLQERIEYENRKIFLIYKYKAKKCNQEFSLSLTDFNKTIRLDCFYCGTKPCNHLYLSHSKGTFYYNGIDRIDSSKGYIKGNCVPCCKYCNYSKLNFPLFEWANWIEKIYGNIDKIKSVASEQMTIKLNKRLYDGI